MPRTPRTAAPLAFSRLYLPRPLNARDVSQLFTMRAATHATGSGHQLVLETRATSEGVTWLLGAPAEATSALRRALTGLVPGLTVTGLDGYNRTPVRTAKKVVTPATGLPLSVAEPEHVARALFTALSRRLGPDEALVLQLVLGRAHAPAHVPGKVADPRPRSLLHKLTYGVPDAPTDVRSAIRTRAAEHRFQACLRIGVTAPDAARRASLGEELLAALAVVEAPAVRLGLEADDARSLDHGLAPKRASLELSVSEVVALCGWPLGAGDMPGLPSAHPKTLRAAPSIETKERVFARSLAPGDTRLIGVAAKDAVYHGVAIGATGSGKTTLLEHMITADIAAGAPVVVLDPKAQMPERLLATVPPGRWKDVVIIDATHPHPIGFNPLDAAGRDPDVVADGVLGVFKKTFAASWGHRTEDTFSTSFRTLTRAGLHAPDPFTLVDLVRLWTDQAFRSRVVGLATQGSGVEVVGLASFWAEFDSLGPGPRASWLASPMNKLRDVLLRPAAVKILGQARPAFRLRDIFIDRKILLVPLNEGLIGPLTAQLIGSLVIAEVWQATQERALEPGHEQAPGFVYVDEADRFMSGLTVSLPDALARSRSLSVAWFLAVQYWEQMPTEMRSAVQNNARTKVVFKQENYDDAHRLAKGAGELEADDFMALGLHQIYVQPVAGGITTGWALAETLPPSPGTHDARAVRAASYAHHGPPPRSQVTNANRPASSPDLPPVPASTIGRIGRTKRASAHTADDNGATP